MAYQNAQSAVKGGGIRDIRRGVQDVRSQYIPTLMSGRGRRRDVRDERRSARDEIRKGRREMMMGTLTTITSTVGSAVSNTVTHWLAGGGQRSKLHKDTDPLPSPSTNPHEDLGRAVVLFTHARQIIPEIPNIDTAQLGELPS